MSGLWNSLRRPWVVVGARIVVGLVFAVSGLAKIGDMASFALQIHNFRMLPIWSEHLVAMTLPWVELVAALGLVLGIRPRSSALITTVLMAVFTVAVAVALSRGLDIECGCFGTADATRVGFWKLLQNVGLLAVSAVALLRRRDPAG